MCFGSSSESSSLFQLCFVTVVCSEGLKQKMSTYFSLDCNSFFLYQIFIGHDDILGVGEKKLKYCPASLFFNVILEV